MLSLLVFLRKSLCFAGGWHERRPWKNEPRIAFDTAATMVCSEVALPDLIQKTKLAIRRV